MRKQVVRETPTQETTHITAATLAAVLEPPTGIGLTGIGDGLQTIAPSRKQRRLPPAALTKRFAAAQPDDHATNRQAELFYLQKQIQLQTQMVLILEDGLRIQGVIEWYDRNCMKVRGKSRVLVYKSAIKYLYKAGEVGSAPE
jgi:sRNA-binding regulator protein Hfq